MISLISIAVAMASSTMAVVDRELTRSIAKPSPGAVSPRPAELGATKNSPKVAVAKPVGEQKLTRCLGGREDRSNDACAQWVAADAAYDSARWAWWQLLVGAAATFVGGATLVAAIFAARYARDAAREAKRGSDAAALAVSNADALQRPWIAISVKLGVGLVQSNGWLRVPFELSFTNIGATYASNVKIAVSEGVSSKNDEFPTQRLWDIDIKPDENGLNIMPSETLFRHGAIFKKVEEIEWAADGFCDEFVRLYILASVAYASTSFQGELHTARTFSVGIDDDRDFFVSNMIPKWSLPMLSDRKLVAKLSGYAKTW